MPAAFAFMPVPQSRPWLRFPPPLIEPDLRISRIRLSDELHERACAGLRRRAHLLEVEDPQFPMDLGVSEATGSTDAQLVPSAEEPSDSFFHVPDDSLIGLTREPKLKYSAHRE